MVALYAAAGVMFLLTDVLGEYVHRNRNLFGILCLAYAAFRGFMIYRKIRYEKSQNQ